MFFNSILLSGMFTGMKHGHLAIVILFLLMFGYKTFLLLTGKTEQLEVVRNKTKVLEMIFGTLILVTGGYLLSQQAQIETLLYVKFALFLVGIPLGIIGLKKGKKALALIAFLSFIMAYGIAEMNAKKRTQAPQSTEAAGEAVVDGKVLYVTLCERCHGTDGKAGFSGAADLSVTVLTAEQHAEIIKNGKGTMPKFGDLSEAQVKALTDYIATLKK